MRPTRAEIDISNFEHNLRFVRGRVGSGTKIMAIIKANAYGHGLEIIAKAAIASGEVYGFGVATEEEGEKLRTLTDLPILVLTTVLEDEIDVLLKHDLDFTLTEPSLVAVIAARARALGKKGRIHLKIDTGMRRVGIRPEEAIGVLRSIIHESDTLELIGLSTHFATSDELDLTFFELQLSTFRSVVQEARHAAITIPLAHAANSGAILQRPIESGFDMVRPGIMLYGYTPSKELDSLYGRELRPALEFVSSVAFVKRIAAGDGVSYNLRWRASRPTTLLTIPVGYGDGYPRALTNRTSVVINGKPYPVVGTICMDQIMVDADQDEIHVGDRAVLIGPRSGGNTAWTLAETVGTIPYEILTNIAQRVPRIATKITRNGNTSKSSP